jgi:hypothetical protein
MWGSAIDMTDNCATLAAGWIAFTGAVLGGLFTAVGVWWTIKSAERAKDEENNRVLLGLYQAIHAEITSFLESFVTGQWGQSIESLQGNNIVRLFLPIGQDYFCVYRNNTGLVGLIPDPEIRQTIVSTYVHMMGTIDNIACNNSLLKELEQIHNLCSAEHRQHFNRMVKYAEILKSGHDLLKKEIPPLLVSLETAAGKAKRNC